MMRMDSKDRLNDFQLETILNRMEISGDEIIIDVGACTGAFSLPIAEKLPRGHLYAVDVDDVPLSILKSKILHKSIKNISPTLIKEGTIPIERNFVDKIYICTVLHEIEDKNKFLLFYHQFLKPGGKIYIVEFMDSRRSLNDTSGVEREYILNSTSN